MFATAARQFHGAGGAFIAEMGVSLVGAALFSAAIGKAVSPREALIALSYAARLAGGGPMIIAPALWLLVGAELILGAMLIAGVRRRGATVATLCLLGVFTAWAGYLHINKLDVPCGCGLGSKAGPALLRNLVMLGVCATSLVSLRGENDPED